MHTDDMFIALLSPFYMGLFQEKIQKIQIAYMIILQVDINFVKCDDQRRPLGDEEVAAL
jgi:hypothetical protein